MEMNSLADWHAWRHSGIGSSDAPVIMKASPWKTPFQLWEEKCGSPKADHDPNYAQARGHKLEPKARAHYEVLHSLEMPPTLLVHPKIGFLRASLDGYNKERGIVLEIKCPGAEDHSVAVDGKIPEKYIWQLYHQMNVSGCDLLHYFSYFNGSGALVEVRRDEPKIKELMKEEIRFWDCVLLKKPPEYTERDYVPVEDVALLDLIKDWKAEMEKSERVQEAIDELREKIEREVTAPRMKAPGVKIQKTTKKGPIKYNEIPQLRGVDLEIYRAPGSEYFTFRLER